MQVQTKDQKFILFYSPPPPKVPRLALDLLLDGVTADKRRFNLKMMTLLLILWRLLLLLLLLLVELILISTSSILLPVSFTSSSTPVLSSSFIPALLSEWSLPQRTLLPAPSPTLLPTSLLPTPPGSSFPADVSSSD